MNQENKNTTQANETTESKNQTFASESNAESTKNLTVSLPMQTSTSNAQNTHRLDAIRSVHKEQKTIKEETVNANSSNTNEAPVTGNEKVSNFKPTSSKETQNPNSPNIGTGVPPTYNSAAATSTAACKKDKKQLASMFGIGFLGALLACVLFFGVCSFTGVFGSKTTINSGTTTLGSDTSSSITASDTSTSLAEAVSAKCLPSVVSVSVYGNNTSSSSIFDYLGGSNSGSNSSSSTTQIATGSGVVISKDGYILTNQHVIEDGTGFEVTVNGKSYTATLVGSDSSSDIAVLKVEPDEELTAIELGDSDSIKTGEWVMTIGSPFGLEQSVATGIVSATSRSQIAGSSDSNTGSSTEVRIYPNMIQTDAAINPGNSGGALVNENGQLVGINTLITSSSGNYSGVGFAIPVNYAIGIARDLIDGKTPTYAQLGVTCTTVTDQIAKRYGFSVTSGAYVSSVVEGSGAAEGGIQKGDIITEFDGEAVTSSSELTLDVRKKEPGDKVSVKLVRDKEEKTVEITLGSGSSTGSSSSSQGQYGQSQGQNGQQRGSN